MYPHNNLAEANDLKVFQTVVERECRFLSAYGFGITEAMLLLPGMWILLRNSTTELSVNFEYGSGLWVTLNRLVESDGALTGGEGYDLNFLLRVRAPARVKPAVPMEEFDESTVSSELADRADALRHFATDVLQGDFSVFPALKRLSDERVARLRRAGEV